MHTEGAWRTCINNMSFSLDHRVCLITGASGIAAATALLAAQSGARVFIAANVEEQCQALSESLRKIGNESDFHIGDLSLPENAATAVEKCRTRFGRIDCLFNVAGISGRRFGDGPVHECTDEGWQKTMNANLTSTFLMCREVVKAMLDQDPGRNGIRGSILNMSSVLALSPEPEHFATHAYAAGKGAIISLTKSMAAYYAQMKIRVNAIAPGLTRTPMSARAQSDPAIIELMKTKQPLSEDLIEAQDVAHAALFLLSDEARYITGEVLTVDAGWRLI